METALFRLLSNFAGFYPTLIGAADFNRDGYLDLATADYFGFPNGSVGLLLGNGDGTFRATVEYGAGNQPLSINSE